VKDFFVVHYYMNFPIEIIDEILNKLDRKEAFRIANSLNKSYHNSRIRDYFLLNAPETSLDEASRKGHVDLLKWYLEQKTVPLKELKYSTRAIGYAAENNHIHVLKWWFTEGKKAGLQVCYDEYAVEAATRKGHLDVLKFFHDNNIPMKWKVCPEKIALSMGHEKLVKWWISSGQLRIWAKWENEAFLARPDWSNSNLHSSNFLLGGVLNRVQILI
jgi:hypothetical protein